MWSEWFFTFAQITPSKFAGGFAALREMKAQVAEVLENLARVLRASEEEWEVVSQGEEPRSSHQEKEVPKQLPVQRQR